MFGITGMAQLATGLGLFSTSTRHMRQLPAMDSPGGVGELCDTQVFFSAARPSACAALTFVETEARNLDPRLSASVEDRGARLHRYLGIVHKDVHSRSGRRSTREAAPHALSAHHAHSHRDSFSAVLPFAFWT